MKWLWRLLWVLAIGLILFGVAPLVSVIVASELAAAHGCTLHEGFVNPCVIGGQDRGEVLYQMAVAGWLMMLTLPFAALGVALALGLSIRALVVRSRARRL